jgi:Alpha galactosidase A/Alpha galactosidase C-terminal beta sandwich domain/NPCBM-associated, NEW3 domain of alpha-galactosidase/Alpha-galactosidase, CBM13 domain
MKGLVRALVAGLPVAPLIAVITLSAAPAAHAENNGVGLTPAMGWSSWSFLRHGPTAANIEAEAAAMKSSGLASVGYRYVNLDDFWYQCPGSQGPAVDQYGRWVVDSSKFPADPPTGRNGIQVVAGYVHSLGLKFGLYVTPGISAQAVAQNTPILGPDGQPSGYTADQIAEPSVHENNYNCGGMVGIDYSKPGAQDFIDSWADEFASWGVDYLKLDGVGSFDIPDVQAWSQALEQTGRPIHLELSNSLNIADASTWAQYSNGWRTGGDIECYACEPSGSSYPLTDWANVESRFDQVAAWQPYGGPGAFNDYDSIEVGNGSNDGLTLDERMTQLSLWALASSPLILGTDLTNLDPADLALLKNTAVIAVDQDAIDASRIVDAPAEQVFAKTEPNGNVIVGLFNTTTEPEVISTSAGVLGLPTGTDYFLNDLWAHQTTETAGAISANVPPHGVALYRVSPDRNPTQAPPNGTMNLAGLSTLTGGQPVTATETFTNNGDLAAKRVSLGVQAPSGWTVTPTSATTFPAVDTGQTVQATFQVVAPAPSGLFGSGSVTGTAIYTWAGRTQQSLSVAEPVTVARPVQAPYRTYSSAADTPASFAQSGQQFGIVGGGADLWTDADAYSSIYQPGVVGTTATITTEVTSQQNMTGFAKAGIMVRNDITGSGSTPEGVVLFESPEGGIQLEWDNNGGTSIDAVTPPNGTIPESLPVYLQLQRNGDSYTGYYSYDGQDWLSVGTATVPGQAASQDAGMFLTSHASGSAGQAVFNGFTVASGATPPPLATSYEAEAPGNTLAGGAVVASCSTCSGGDKVGFVGSGGTLTFNGVTAPAAGSYQVTIAYLDGSATGRQAMISVTGGTPQMVSFTPTGSFSTVGTMTVPLQLTAGSNTIEFGNPSAYAPDFDRIIVAAAPG